MYIIFRSQEGIGEVAKEVDFNEGISLKSAHLNARDGERGLINSKV